MTTAAKLLAAENKGADVIARSDGTLFIQQHVAEAVINRMLEAGYIAVHTIARTPSVEDWEKIIEAASDAAHAETLNPIPWHELRAIIARALRRAVEGDTQ